ncbi:hypothetical protein ASNO1_19280 [Corallococcus caeni]|uniref:Uncharacterized protein n=1 Tax=Corallococcus caeni TaxID=3082388 RepID=A0ABQ6QNU0_9BACT|nr:hypothetical protein ASNO1_19280 [Corallococcus sp. NO1]
MSKGVLRAATRAKEADDAARRTRNAGLLAAVGSPCGASPDEGPGGCAKRGWPATVSCGSTPCFVSSCGEGKCPYCFIKGMENLVFTGWAVYTCTTGDAVPGKALLFNTAPFNARLGPICG